MSALLTRNREKWLQELRETQMGEEWCRRVWAQRAAAEAKEQEKAREQQTTTVWATRALRRLVDASLEFFEKAEDPYNLKTFWLPALGKTGLLATLVLEIEPSKDFQNQAGATIV